MKGFPTYKLTDAQLRGIGCIVAHEQGSVAGYFAEASQIANLAELQFGGNLVKCVTSGWYAHGKDRYRTGTSNPVVLAIVRRVLMDGYRTLPRYVDEHDCMSDLASVTEGGKNVKGSKKLWKRHSTVIKNKMGSRYLFYDFPGGYKTGVDPFGYKHKSNREKFGDFCYSVEEAWAPIPRILAFAMNEIGYLEKRSNRDLTSKTANAGRANFTKYGKWIGANGDYWCASFVSWCFGQAFGQALGKQLLCGSFSAACETIRQNFIRKKQYHTFLTGAKPGDVIFFKGSRHSGANHIGIIYMVGGGKIYTIEGNTSSASGVVDNGGCVTKKAYKTIDTRILGYGRPDYYSETPVKQPDTPTESVKGGQGTVYYPKCKSGSTSLTDALKSAGVKDVSLSARKKIAARNGITNYSGSAVQNIKMLQLLKDGRLIRP